MAAEPASAATPAVEIACDESGSEGRRLVGGNTDVFAHAGVDLSAETAASCIAEIRDRVRSPAVEYKANHLLREKHRSVLVWFLGPSAPVLGHAHVYLVEKTYLALVRLVAIAAGEPGALTGADRRVRAMASAVYRAGPARLGPRRWRTFLDTANDILRVQDEDADPLVSAVEAAVSRWGADGSPVAIVHDRQNMLTADKVAGLRHLDGLTELRFSASTDDPRIQVADFVAGVARRIAEDHLHGRGDPELVELIRPYVDPASIWGDQVSWSALGPEAWGPAGSTGEMVS